MDFPLKIKRMKLDPAPCLRAPNADVDAPWEDLEPWADRMFKVMYSCGNGVGLSACQVGWNVRLFVMNWDSDHKKPQAECVFWNPVLDGVEGEPLKLWEGCLSLPKVFGWVLRYPSIRLKAMTPLGPIEEWFDGRAAHIIQHELDHMKGELCWEKFLPADKK